MLSRRILAQLFNKYFTRFRPPNEPLGPLRFSLDIYDLISRMTSELSILAWHFSLFAPIMRKSWRSWSEFVEMRILCLEFRPRTHSSSLRFILQCFLGDKFIQSIDLALLRNPLFQEVFELEIISRLATFISTWSGWKDWPTMILVFSLITFFTSQTGIFA